MRLDDPDVLLVGFRVRCGGFVDLFELAHVAVAHADALTKAGTPAVCEEMHRGRTYAEQNGQPPQYEEEVARVLYPLPT